MTLDISKDPLKSYLDGLVPDRPETVAAMEARAREERFPIIGPACGHLCYQVARMIGARQVFEMGSGFGYSTYWFARAVRENGGGVVHHTVWDEDLSAQARQNLEALGVADLVTFHVKEATEALRDTPGVFDIVFCDIDKDGYPAAFDIARERVRPGGVVIFDNLLWGGRLFDDEERRDSTEGIRAVNRAIFTDPDFIASMIPLRDGMCVAWKSV